MMTGIFAFTLLLAPSIAGPAELQEDEVIATLNGETIRLSEAKETVAFQVYRLRGNIYLLLKRETERIVDQKLLDAEAARRGLTVAELLRKEVDEKTSPLSAFCVLGLL